MWEFPNVREVKEAAFIQDFHDFRLTIRGSDKKWIGRSLQHILNIIKASTFALNSFII